MQEITPQKIWSMLGKAHEVWDMPALKMSLHASAAPHACMMIQFLNTTSVFVRLVVQCSFYCHNHIMGKVPGTKIVLICLLGSPLFRYVMSR